MHPRPIARKRRFPLWSVSPHICRCGSIGQLLRLMVLTLSGWKPIHHTGEMVREGKEGRGRGESGGGGKHNGGAVLHSFKRLFITMVPLSDSLPVYPWGESNPCQTHLWAWTWRNGPSWSETDRLQAIWDTWMCCFQCCQIAVLSADVLNTEDQLRVDIWSVCFEQTPPCTVQVKWSSLTLEVLEFNNYWNGHKQSFFFILD